LSDEKDVSIPEECQHARHTTIGNTLTFNVQNSQKLVLEVDDTYLIAPTVNMKGSEGQ
jgi:hypothetical protein